MSLLSPHVNPVAGEEMPGEGITGHRAHNLPVNLQLPPHVQVPHVDVSGVQVPWTIVLVRHRAERDGVTSNKTTLDQA